MNRIFTPQLLNDRSRLQEIYDLRVEAYEHSPKSVYVNKKIFPNGLFDDLDERENTLHWIVEDNGKIIAAARLAIIYDVSEIKDIDDALNKYAIPNERPFVYYSRLIVHHDFRKLGLVNLLDKIRMDYLQENKNLNFAIAFATSDRDKALMDYGFKRLGYFNYTWGGKAGNAQSMFLLQLPKNI